MWIDVVGIFAPGSHAMSKTSTPRPVPLSELPLENETESRQFVMQVGAHRARIEYDHQGDRMFLTRTDVPARIEDPNVAPVLTEKVLTWIDQHNLKLVPLCRSVKAHLRNNPDWKRLLLKGLHV
jgi:hypothetical protein